MERSLVALYARCRELGVNEIAMPRVGCGLDRLNWNIVKGFIEHTFPGDFNIKVYSLRKVSSKLPVYID